MKSLIIATLLLGSAACFAQTTNVYWATNYPTPPIKRTFVTPNVWTSGLANFRNEEAPTTNWWYVEETNVITAWATNANLVVQYGSSWGASGSGYGSVTFTNTLWPNDNLVRFSIYWPTNLTPVQTNAVIPLVVIGTHPKDS